MELLARLAFAAAAGLLQFVLAASRNPTVTGIALVLGNMLPLVGVLFFGWSISEILWIYWLETVIIGFYNILKLLLAATHDEDGQFIFFGFLPGLLSAAWFIVHFGGVLFGYGMVLFSYSKLLEQDVGFESLEAPNFRFLESVFLSDGAWGAHPGGVTLLAWALLGLCVSHGMSFFLHFIREKEYVRHNTYYFFSAPYKRIILVQITIMAGAFGIMISRKYLPGWTDEVLAGLWVVAKIVIDLWAHREAHSVAPAGDSRHAELS